ncbi:HNH endonuclease [Alteromonas sp. McT4-15]|uniref:HNH endonuclease n=1 Tax=Alteromonas sp. McT4-15 TaxID=2881256 RepID=UPI001CF8D128|nr:HNH endonuclease signature motif containing protein [Alteromonas sp. McT4-15]MCB4435549.1 HNH endonuclease [Alteromonas sp. McT4-15]
MKRNFDSYQRSVIFDRSGGKCAICDCHLGSDWHADHRVPFSKGGRTVIRNGQALCKRCNLFKSNHLAGFTPNVKRAGNLVSRLKNSHGNAMSELVQQINHTTKGAQ